jgi:hypothetical protein
MSPILGLLLLSWEAQDPLVPPGHRRPRSDRNSNSLLQSHKHKQRKTRGDAIERGWETLSRRSDPWITGREKDEIDYLSLLDDGTVRHKRPRSRGI